MYMGKKVLIATGGTGGHIYPAIALAHQLKEEYPDCEILFVGGGLLTNRFFDKELFPHKTISCGSIVNLSPKALAGAFLNIAKGIWQTRRIIRTFKPDIAVGFGSYFAFPALVAAKMLSIPFVLHEANSIPGKVNRLLAPFAEVTGVHFPETVGLLKGKSLEVGMPLRPAFLKLKATKDDARRHFGLDSDKVTILVFGGSLGAHSINVVVRQAFKQLVGKYRLQILHIAGEALAAAELRELYASLQIPAVVRPYEERMELAWRAADLVIARAGAGTLAEQLEFEVPGILIPYPRASENHQEHNADFMVAKVGGAVKINEKGLSSERLGECLELLLKDDGAILKQMWQAMQLYKRRSRTKDLCALVTERL